MTAQTYTARVADYFRARPGVWIRATELEAVGGRQAWRTRVSDARRLGLPIRNRCRRVMLRSGEMVTVSEYCYVPPEPAGQAALPLEARA